ncbi:MAG: exodeoxyribonuclease VII large subunit [Lachnospiraceae bacterium]|nr:exodeoxyribonuclease VII large subunit [Lachnospiraceae bacterium]
MQKRIYSVGQINTYIKNMFQGDYLLSGLYMKGEVSNCKYHTSGHIYFSLKDETGAIGCVMFKGNRNGLKFQLQDGQCVIVGGNITVYERDGKYQLYAKEITLDGAGALYEEYERLKAKLYEEGLFEFDIKKPIPQFPKRIGIVTAPTGAAIQDIRNIAKRRNPYVQLILYPAKVQGDGAAATIVKGIQVLDKMGVDTIIIGRGGGSIEDLWAFNEEMVARAIYEAKTPIISGTGHEVDTTIADYAADLRAPTPSAACELAIPDYMSTWRNLEHLQEKMTQRMWQQLEMAKLEYKHYETKLQYANPVSKLEQQKQYLDQLWDRLDGAMLRKYESCKHQLAVLTERLHGCSPTGKLVHGYGYLEKQGKPISSVQQVEPGDSIKITIHDGTILTKVEEIV